MLQGDRAASASLQTAMAEFEARKEIETFRTEVGLVTARVTGHSVITVNVKWKYTWEEVRFNSATSTVVVKPLGLSTANAGHAYNWNELNNVANFWAPLGSSAGVPAGFLLKPIAIGTPILLWSVRDLQGKQHWVFDKVNAIDGVCEEP